MKILTKLIQQLRSNLPLVGVILVAVIIALVCIKPQAYYTGWDNILAELNFPRYVKQVVFGSWLEHQGLGAPAAQGHLADIPRLPIMWLFKVLLPDNLLRYAYIFFCYLAGGVTTYFYLKKYWIKDSLGKWKKWLAGVGGIFYLLHILTLQQFYIAFEMFMAQYAFLPLVLITIHQLAEKFNKKNLFYFFGAQLLIAPSGHVPTIVYLATLFFLAYSFFLKLKSGFMQSLKFSFLIGLLTFLSHAYWILPNVYYTLHNSHYVAESHENQIFANEVLWSVRQAGTISNFLAGTQYLFTWKDYSFADRDFSQIFDEWLPYLNQPSVKLTLQVLGAITVIGFYLTIIDHQKSNKRFAVLLVYLIATLMIWIDLFMTNTMVDQLFEIAAFREAFRNPFTKLSIIYSFVSVLLFIQTLEFIIQKTNKKFIFSTLLLISTTIAIIYTSWPSFQGHFISEKLQIQYPQEYFELFDYLKDQDEDLRLLALPQMSHAGWVYHQWGYQGMGFLPHAIPQPVLNRDSDRWVESSDSFYHQLKYALDRRDVEQFSQLLSKYQVDLILIDESKIDPGFTPDYQLDHQLVKQADLDVAWQKDFLTLYQRPSASTSQLLIPSEISMINTELIRARFDSIFDQVGHYISAGNTSFPLANLMTKELDEVEFKPDSVQLFKEIPAGEFELVIPGIDGADYQTPAAVSYQGTKVKVEFPQTIIQSGENQVSLPQLPNFEFETDQAYPQLIIFIDSTGVIVGQNQVAQPVISAPVGHTLDINYLPKQDGIEINQLGQINLSLVELNHALRIYPDWSELKQDLTLTTNHETKLSVKTYFPVVPLDLAQKETVNCSQPEEKGSIWTYSENGQLTYQANDYAVNCHAYNFDYLSNSTDYLIQVSGENISGRGIKFFINFDNGLILPEDFMFDYGQYQRALTLPQTSTEPTDKFIFNWETRSFGKESINQLTSIQVAHLPISQLAKAQLNPTNKIDNNLTITQHHQYLDSTHSISLNCQSKTCYLALDQSFDDLWLMIDFKQRQLLPHLKLNNWANVWEIPQGEHRVKIIYLPQLMAISGLALVAELVLYLIKK